MPHLRLTLGLVAIVLMTGFAAPKWKPMDPAREPELQAMATTACSCAREAPEKREECWAAYEQATKGVFVGESYGLCDPLRSRNDCFNSGSPDSFCVWRGGQVGKTPVCTRAEAEIVFDAMSTLPEAGDQRRAQQVVGEAALKRHLNGETVSLTHGKFGGCG